MATGHRRQKMEKKHYWVNGTAFSPKIISTAEELEEKPSLAIICVKNYDIESAIEDLRPVIVPGTILLPLQNGIYAIIRNWDMFMSTKKRKDGTCDRDFCDVRFIDCICKDNKNN